MRSSGTLLKPPARPPVDATRAGPDDPPPPSLQNAVTDLSHPIPLHAVQARNRLRQAGVDGTLAVAAYLDLDAGDLERRREAARYLADLSPQEFGDLSESEAEIVRASAAEGLSSDDIELRVICSRVLQIHGPGAQRTRLLGAIADPERRVRWAVVRRFGQYPNELDLTQRRFLLKFLEAGTRDEFAALDTDADGGLSRTEYTGSNDAFASMDRDSNGKVTLAEWIRPVPDAVRADVLALLHRMHAKLSPELEPPGYNPYAPAADQLDSWRQWTAWVEGLK